MSIYINSFQTKSFTLNRFSIYRGRIRVTIAYGSYFYRAPHSFFLRGEVVRQVLVDLIQEGLMFVGHDSSELQEHGRFYTKYVSEIESDPVGDFTLCRQALADLGLDQVSDEDCSAVRYVCECVSRRAGFMVSAGITALLKKMDYKDVVVAIDGNLT